jgi:hypothetical protein
MKESILLYFLVRVTTRTTNGAPMNLKYATRRKPQVQILHTYVRQDCAQVLRRLTIWIHNLEVEAVTSKRVLGCGIRVVVYV